MPGAELDNLEVTRLREAFDLVCESPREAREEAIARIAETEPAIAFRLTDLLMREESGRSLGALFSFEDVPAFKPLDPGTCVGSAKIDFLIARGPLAEVYKARHLVSDRPLAVKLLLDHSSLLHPFSAYEARILGALDHAGIVPVQEAGVFCQREGVSSPYLVMPYIEGENLRVWAAKSEASGVQIAAMMARVARAVEHAHVRRVIHRDLKPANLLVDQDGSPHVLDFGIGLVEDQDGRYAHAGTPGYMAPEQVDPNGPPIDGRADIYGLGVMLAELLTGHRPSKRNAESGVETRARVDQHLKDAGVDRQLREVVLTATAGDLAERYSFVGEFAEDLERIASGRPILAVPPSRPRRLVLAVRRRPGLALLCAISATAIVAAIVGTTTQSVRATRALSRSETRYEHARNFANWVIHDLDDQLSTMPNSTETRLSVIKTAMETLDALQQTADGDRDILLDIAEARLAVARVLFNGYGQHLGQQLESDRVLRQIEPIVRPLAASGDMRANRVLLGVLEGYFWTRSDLEPARIAIEEADLLADRIMPRTPEVLTRSAMIAALHGRCLSRTPDRARQEEAVRKSLDRSSMAQAGSIDDPKLLRMLGLVELWAGLFEAEGDPLAGGEHFEAGAELFSRMGTLEDGTEFLDLSKAQFCLAGSQAQNGRLSEALITIDHSIAIARRWVARDKADYAAARALEVSLGKAAEILANSDLEGFEQNERAALRSLAVRRIEEAIGLLAARERLGGLFGPERNYPHMYRELLEECQRLAEPRAAEGSAVDTPD